VETPFKIYNASAGSGKTYTLTKEYLKIILSSSRAYKKILAITFTNKAVNEMKERILGSLFDFSQGRRSSMFEDLTNELELDAGALQQKATNTLKEILHNYAFFDISTIDKFTHRLIRTFAKDLKLPQNFEVVLDRDLLLDEAVSRLINKAGRDSKLTKVLVDFALEKIDDDKSWDIAFDLNKVGNLIFNETDIQHLKKLENKSIDEFLVLQRTIQKKIHNLEKTIASAASQALQTIDDNGLEHADFKSSYFPKFILKIQKEDFVMDFNAAWKQNFDSAPLYASKCDETKKSILDNLQPQFVLHFNAIKHSAYSHQLLKNVYKNIVPLTVLNAIQQEVKTIQMERDQLSISEFNSIISNEIKNQPAPFIYERLGEKYRHYFIDEFQDTSEMQWMNLIPLVDNALSTENGSLFLVGDAKQAIYRWRGGKAEQFLNLVNRKTNPFVISPEVQQLPQNYRSHEEIIKFNNEFFTSTSPILNNEIYRTLFEDGNQQEHNAKKGGLVQLAFLEPEDHQNLEIAYCEEVLKTIEIVIEKNYTHKDICILVRGNKEGVLLADYLTQYQIPIISSESLLLKSNPKICFLIHLLKLQDQPNDRDLAYEILSFLSIEMENRHLFISKHLKNPSAILKSSFGYDLEKLKTISVFDGLEYAIKLFDLAPDSDGYMNHFMDVVIEVEQKEGIGAPLFLAYWEKKKDRLGIAAPEAVNAVQIMTVHKAKGLEFEIVIFPFANANIYKEIEPKLWLPVESTSFNGFEEVLITKKQEVIHYSLEAEELYHEEQHKLELDAFNVLYVALTRAVKALFILTKKDLTKTGDHKLNFYSGLFIHFLKEKGRWNETMSRYSFGLLETNLKGQIANNSLTIPYQYSFKDRPSFRILAKSGVLWDTDREDALSKGNLIHFIMGLIETHKEIESVMAFVIRSGDLASDEIELLKNKIHTIVEHPKLAQYYKEGLEIKNEKDIITENGKILRPDRIVIHNSKATIIDYKTGKRNTKYKEQLYSYADALEAMGYAIENKIIIYINETVIPEFI
jgi:ATP-dependent exoDNAse (exonuclease V) beta subunit